MAESTTNLISEGPLRTSVSSKWNESMALRAGYAIGVL